MQPIASIERFEPRPVAPSRVRLDRFFKALADDTRRKILRLLEDGELTVTEIVAQFHLAQPTISRHLAVLRDARLVSDRRSGQHVHYSLNPAVLADGVDRFFGAFESCRR